MLTEFAQPTVLRHSVHIASHNEFARKPLIVRVSKKENIEPNFYNLIDKLGCDLRIAQNMPELFKILNDTVSPIDAILIDLPKMYTIFDTNAFEIVSTIHTLVNAHDFIDLDRKDIPLGIVVSKDDQPELIRGILGPEIKILFPKNDWTQSGDSEQALRELLSGHNFIPRKILDMAKKSNKSSQQKRSATNSNKIQLTVRQEQILNLIRDRGASNKVIAKMLKISESTVKLHITAILKKYGVRNRTQLALFSNKDKES